MGFQTTILDRQAFGNVGEFADNSPNRTLTAITASADPADNVFGRAFTRNGQVDNFGTVEAGGTGIFFGFLIAPKEQALLGTAIGTLEPSLTIPNNLNAAFCNMGVIFVKLPAVANVGDKVIFDQADGTLQTIAPAVALPVGTTYANAQVYEFNVADVDPNDGEYLAVIRITDVPAIPV